jgi:hypothetical protein
MVAITEKLVNFVVNQVPNIIQGVSSNMGGVLNVTLLQLDDATSS